MTVDPVLQDKFVSPTRGVISFEAMFQDILDYIKERPNEDYRLIIGTDSQVRDDVCFVTAVIIHRTGKGGRYYYQKRRMHKIHSLRQKLFYETSLSLGLASKLAERIAADGVAHLNLEIHLDVGERGQTKELIKEIVGMVVGSGFDAKIKPESYGASKVADKYTK